MALHNDLGKAAEDLAAEWLVTRGYRILHRNWRYSHYEIDIIACREGKLHIVEVKARTATAIGNPEDSVTRKKFKSLQRATDEFLYRNPGYSRLQYDILAITFRWGKAPVFFLLEDVYL